MAETLTYDNSPDTVSAADNLTTDEQDSLQVGEQLVAEQEQLLAGKYKNAEELEKAYVELQQKLGNKSTDNDESTQVTDSTEEKTEVEEKPVDENKPDVNSDDYALLETLWEEAQTDFTEETTDKISDLSNEQLVNMHLAYRKNVEDNYIASREMTQEESAELQDVVGGPEQYKSMINWAGNNLTSEEVDMFDQAITRGDPLSCFFAVRALQYRYEDATGRSGEMVTGKAPSVKGDTFRSQAEVVKAMSDDRYDNDPAYRNDVMKKLERSNVEF